MKFEKYVDDNNHVELIQKNNNNNHVEICDFLSPIRSCFN